MAVLVAALAVCVPEASADWSGDTKADDAVRLRLRRPAGTKGRVYARVFFRRPGTRKLRHKTVARRFVMCG